MTCESCLRKDEIISEILTENHKLKERIEQLEQKNKQLEEQIKEIKSYIWKPKIQTDKPKKLGPPNNHEPNNRSIPDKIHRKQSLSLKECPCCGDKLSKPVKRRKRYVEDIRPPEPMNTEYDIPSYYCKRCKKQVSPKPADVVPRCRFGIRMMMLITFLRYGLSLPLNKIAKELRIVYGITISEGCLVDSITRFAHYTGPEFEQIKKEVKRLATVNVDESGWRINGKNVWLWDFIGKKVALLLIRNTRGRAVAEDVIGKGYKGVVVSDCLATYTNLGKKQQKCWAHILRRTRKISSDEGKLLHKRLKELIRQGDSGEASEEELLKRLDRILRVKYTDYRCEAVINTLNKHRDSWFTYVSEEDVDSTNNAAERGLKPSIVMRKITGGNRSDKGARNHEVIMSVMQTWNLQEKDFFEESNRVIRENLP